MKQYLQDKDKLIEELREAREDLKKNFELQSLEIIQLNEELQHFQQAPEIAKLRLRRNLQVLLAIPLSQKILSVRWENSASSVPI